MYTSKLGSDTIESFFGTLRRHTGPRASASVVMLSMRSLMLSKINELGGSLSSIRASNKAREQCTPAFKAMAMKQLNKAPRISAFLSKTEKQALYYMSGFIGRRIMDQNELCFRCKLLLLSKTNGRNLARWQGGEVPCELLPPEFFTFQRNFGGLVYVSYPVFNFLCGVAVIFNEVYEVFKCSTDIVEVIREQLVLNLDLLPWLPSCNCKLPELLIDYSVKPMLNAHLNRINRFGDQQESCAQRRTKCYED